MANKTVLKRGLTLPISGEPEQVIYDALSVRTVACIGADFHGMKPTMLVNAGDDVKVGQPLFQDKRSPGVVYTAPASGRVVDIHRGVRRVLQSVVIEKTSECQHQAFEHYAGVWDQQTPTASSIKDLLLESGLWTALRTRPFSKVPAIDSQPKAIFVNAMDSNPLAPDPAQVLRCNQNPHFYRDWFEAGLAGLARLASGLASPKLFLTRRSNSDIPTAPEFETHEFDGPHPSGLIGTHIHFLYPADQQHVVWHLNYQDVIAIGHLLRTGTLWTDRVIALAGPEVEQPRLLRVPLGASIDEITAGQLKSTGSSGGEVRRISGSVLSGRHARAPFSYVGRYHLQVSVLREGRDRHLLEYLWPGAKKHSATGVFLSRFLPKKLLPFTTNTNGSERGMVPVGAYERVMPLDLLPTQLLRALIVTDTEMAQALGCLELDEEDLGLCTYVCPGKYEYGPLLRENLTQIELEG
ncbi:MAG: Na(+)-translocating NADH-quinone reductase subunit A [Gammaproteobacteria bacterium]